MVMDNVDQFNFVRITSYAVHLIRMNFSVCLVECFINDTSVTVKDTLTTTFTSLVITAPYGTDFQATGALAVSAM